MALTLLIVAPWLIAIWLRKPWRLLPAIPGRRLCRQAGGRAGKPWRAARLLSLLSAITFWPAILFVLPGIGLGVARQAEPMVRFLLAWAGALVAGGASSCPPSCPIMCCRPIRRLAILAALWLLVPRRIRPQAGLARLVHGRGAAILVGLGRAVGGAGLAARTLWRRPCDRADWPLPRLGWRLIGLGALIMLLDGTRA